MSDSKTVLVRIQQGDLRRAIVVLLKRPYSAFSSANQSDVRRLHSSLICFTY
ncbi:MAG: hypothetical protein SAL70_38130 [Scytonema sp. PMC 1070.18]|nr:hypothetical protein [Scytonema sp. PMC 1070.18]